jgi:hypothetical protein
MDKPKVGDILKDNIIIMKVYEWDNYYDLDVVNRETDESGHVRISK